MHIFYAAFRSFDGLLPRLFIDAFVLRNMAIAAAGGELAACCAPEITLVTIYWAFKFGSIGSCSSGGRRRHRLVTVTATATNTLTKPSFTKQLSSLRSAPSHPQPSASDSAC